MWLTQAPTGGGRAHQSSKQKLRKHADSSQSKPPFSPIGTILELSDRSLNWTLSRSRKRCKAANADGGFS